MSETHKTRSDPLYREFGALLARLRQGAGIAQQSELAALVDTTQQTISRWEAGTSRPRVKQIPRLAAVVNAKPEDLLAAAGYGAPPQAQSSPVATFDQPFPIDALSPESFERFCRDFVEAQYPEAAVHRAGGTGHDQDGVDIQARFDNGTVFTFQCKRVQEFGPQKVHTAVATDTVPASKKFLLVSRIASPQARDAIYKHANWDIWDKDDISTKIRRLAKVDQLRLVDTFFKGRRFELLGENEAGPWETTEEFFAPFESSSGLFNHAWELVGHAEPIRLLAGALDNEEIRCTFLTGSGGAGKTRVLKQVIAQYEASHREVAVRFLSRTSEVTKAALEEFGSRPVLIIVDDAHDRNDLGPLFQFAASRHSPTKLLLAFRPYGLDPIKAQASTFSLVGDPVAEIGLPALSLKDAEELATQVLKKHSGPLEVAKDIARLTLDCPLATVVGAQVVAKEKILFGLAKNEDSFRTTLFGRFENVVAGEIGTKADARPVQQVLKVLALLQPFHPDDPKLLTVLERVEAIPAYESSRLIKLLTNAGVLFKRGARYRLSPDVLADYIIEANCIGAYGKSTGYAELVFSAAEAEQIENLLVNLAKLDWLRSDGDATNSHLLDEVWGKLSPTSKYGDPHIKAVTAVAYYQPAKALEFAERLIRQGQYLDQLPELLKYAAFNMRYATRACEDLWEIGKADDRELNRHPGHAIRALGELCEVRPNKPYEYNEKIVDFGLGLIGKPDSWAHRFTPLDIVTPILKTEAYTTSGNSRSISFKPYFVNERFVAKLREKVVNTILGLLSQPNTKIAALAARRIGDALRYPMGMFGTSVDDAIRAKWTSVFVETLKAIEKAAKAEQVDPLVRYIIAREVSWHADHGPEETGKIARRIRNGLPKSLEFRVLCTLIDGYGIELRRIDPINHLAKQEKRLDALVDEVLAAYRSGAPLRAFIARNLDHLEANGTEKGGSSSFILCDKLIYASPELARSAIDDACSDAPSSVAKFASAALTRLWQLDVVEGRAVVTRFLKSERENLIAAVGIAYSRLDFAAGRHGPEELETLKLILGSESEWVAHTAIAALRRLAQADIEAAVGLVPFANIGTSHRRADELAGLFTWPQMIPFNRLTEGDLKIVLEKLMTVPELDGHWLETFLAQASKAYPNAVANFFVRRVDHAAQTGDWKYRPCNHGPYGNVPLCFRETQEYGSLLASVVRWMKQADYDADKRVLFDYRARELFESLFGSFDGEVVQHLDTWSATADKNDMLLIANILREAPSNFVFTQAPFVERLLERANRLDEKTLKRVSSGLFGSAISGIRQGIPGEPFPRDLEIKSQAENALRSLSRFSPAYELYEGLKGHADWGIERARLDREAFEE